MSYKFQKDSVYYTEYEFYDTVEKKIRSLLIYSPHKQLINEGLTFTSGPDTYKIELSDDFRTIRKSLQWRKNKFNPKLLYRNLNVYFIWHNSDLFSSTDGWLGYYNFMYRNTLNFNPRNIYFVPYAFGYFFDRNPSYGITHKTFYDRNNQTGKKI